MLVKDRIRVVATSMNINVFVVVSVEGVAAGVGLVNLILLEYYRLIVGARMDG